MDGVRDKMLISILVPVYNWDLSPLLERLVREIDGSDLAGRVEVLVLDDASTDASLRAGNAGFVSQNQRPFLKYAALPGNLGRSAIRNRLAGEAAGEFLLFLDCDVLPDSDDFVRSYLAHAEQEHHDVVCGGISYRTRVLNGPAFDYHAYLGRTKEVKGAAQRNAEPWRHILTSNIMVRKSVFTDTPFDERFTGYGYEDIEWGVRLCRDHRVLHIDNTASHLGLVTKQRVYEKMRSSVPNYLLLKELCPEAFAASALSRLVAPLCRCGSLPLDLLDRGLKRLFLRAGSGRAAFLFFQVNFAVLLARAVREERARRSD